MRFSLPSYMKNNVVLPIQSGGLTTEIHAMQQIQALDIDNGR